MRTATFRIALAIFLLSAPAPLPAQEIKTSVTAPSETPSFTFRKRRVRDDADARLADILERIRRHQRYPGVARESGAEGAATVSFRVLPDGRLEGLRIKQDVRQRASGRRLTGGGAKSGAPAPSR